MSINFNHRLTGEDGAHPDARNEAGRNLGQEDATHEQNDDLNSTVEHPRETLRKRGLFLPLAWAEPAKSVKSAPLRGQDKSRVAAIEQKLGITPPQSLPTMMSGTAPAVSSKQAQEYQQKLQELQKVLSQLKGQRE